MRSISVSSFFLLPLPLPPVILFQRVLLPFIHHLVNLASFCRDARLRHCLARVRVFVVNQFVSNGIVLVW